jgi:tetratricopeptide (TPR) repeat protein
VLATISQAWRLIQHGIAMTREHLAGKALGRAQVNLGEKMYQGAIGDQAVRESIRALDDQIEEKRAAKQSVSGLLADRRRLLVRLTETASRKPGPTVSESELRELLARQQDWEDRRKTSQSARAGLKPRNATEIRRIVVGVGTLLIMIFALSVLGRHLSSSVASGKSAARYNDMSPDSMSDDASLALGKAKRAADRLEDGRAKLLAKIAEAYHEAGDQRGCSDTLQESLRLVEKEEGSRAKTQAWAVIASVQRKVGDKAGWENTLTQLDELAREPILAYDVCNALMIITNELALAGEMKRYEPALRQSLEVFQRGATKMQAAQAAWIVVQTMQAMANAGENDRAIKLLEALGRDELSRRHALMYVAIAMGRGGKHEEAVKAADRIGHLESTCNTLWGVAEAEAQAGYVDSAKQTARAIAVRVDAAKNSGLAFTFVNRAGAVSARALLAIGDVQTRRGDLDGARAMFAKAAEAARDTKVDVSGTEDPHRARNAFATEAADLATIAEAHAADGDLSKYRSVIADAERTLKAIQGDQEREDALCRVVRARVRAGDCQRGIAIVDEEKSSTNQISAYITYAKARSSGRSRQD